MLFWSALSFEKFCRCKNVETKVLVLYRIAFMLCKCGLSNIYKKNLDCKIGSVPETSLQMRQRHLVSLTLPLIMQIFLQPPPPQLLTPPWLPQHLQLLRPLPRHPRDRTRTHLCNSRLMLTHRLLPQRPRTTRTCLWRIKVSEWRHFCWINCSCCSRL